MPKSFDAMAGQTPDDRHFAQHWSNRSDESISWLLGDRYNHHLEILSKVKYESVIEAGCGAGGMIIAHQLAFAGNDELSYCAYDINEASILSARKNAGRLLNSKQSKNVNIYKMEDGELVAMPKADLFISLHVLEHIINVDSFLVDNRDNSNLFLFEIPIEAGLTETLRRLARKLFGKEPSPWGHKTFWSKESFLNKLWDCGYNPLLEKEYLSNYYYNPNPHGLKCRLRLRMKSLLFKFLGSQYERVFQTFYIVLCCPRISKRENITPHPCAAPK
jgi:SAM-dependent methyltransferase